MQHWVSKNQPFGQEGNLQCYVLFDLDAYLYKEGTVHISSCVEIPRVLIAITPTMTQIWLSLNYYYLMIEVVIE